MQTMSGAAAEPSPLYQLARVILEQDPAAWIQARHAEGQSWDAIAYALSQKMPNRRRVHRDTVRRWAKGET